MRIVSSYLRTEAGRRSSLPSTLQTTVSSERRLQRTPAHSSVRLTRGRVLVRVSLRTFVRYSRPPGVRGQPQRVIRSHAITRTPALPTLLVAVVLVHSARKRRETSHSSADSLLVLRVFRITAGDSGPSASAKCSHLTAPSTSSTVVCSSAGQM